MFFSYFLMSYAALSSLPGDGSPNRDDYLRFRAKQLDKGVKYTAHQIADIWGISEDRTVRTLYVMKKKGFVYQDGHLYYR